MAGRRSDLRSIERLTGGYPANLLAVARFSAELSNTRLIACKSGVHLT
jgi:hypothetical protein